MHASSWDPVWEQVFQQQPWGKYPDESFIRFVARNFYKRQRPQTKLLEVGCGPGANVWFMAREGFDVYAIDASATAVERARACLQTEGLRADLRVGDIIGLPFEDGSFDAVADNECLAHNNAGNLEKILREIHRVLKKDGLLYSRTFTSDVYTGRIQTRLAELEYKDASDGPFGGRGFFRLSTPESIRQHYGKTFNIVSLDKIEYTCNNGAVKISEWVIVCQK